MTPPRRKLPIGIDTFSEIISDDYYYVDKTDLVHRFVEDCKYYLLSRPRGFGKSLLVDTLKELFEGNQALFAGLHIHDKWDWSRKYPVIRVNFGDAVINSRETLDDKIREILLTHQQRLGVTCTYDSISGQFSQLIALAREKYGRRVVVLIDEYDKPYLNNLADGATAVAISQGLINFYSVIKGADADIQFAMLTGITKFSLTTMFSGLNNLNDVTLYSAFSSICGYTDADIDTVFAPELPGLDRAQIRHWYNGYGWSGEGTVYNPVDVLQLFRQRSFDCFWFDAEKPAFLNKLVAMLTERESWLPALGEIVADNSLLSTFDPDSVPTIALMFQCGYLSIAREEHVGESDYYHVGFPNQEVRQCLYGRLLRAWTGDTGAEAQNKTALQGLLATNNLAGLRDVFDAFFSVIPEQWLAENDIARYEGHYASVFYAYFAAAGLDVQAVGVPKYGLIDCNRIDMAVRLAGRTYLIAFKVAGQTLEGKLLQYIKDQGYAEPFRAEGLPISLIGVEFSREKRKVLGFEAEALAPGAAA